MLQTNKLALVLGALMGGFHLLWAMMVALGWAQTLLDFIFRMHFIQPIWVIQPFDIETAILLVVVTSAIGYCIGLIFALTWNSVHR